MNRLVLVAPLLLLLNAPVKASELEPVDCGLLESAADGVSLYFLIAQLGALELMMNLPDQFLEPVQTQMEKFRDVEQAIEYLKDNIRRVCPSEE